MWKYKLSLLDKPEDQFNPDYLLIGDSLLISGVIPSEISEHVYNFGLPGVTPVEAHDLLVRYLNTGRRPKKIFLMLGLTHYSLSDSLWEMTFGYQIRTKKEKKELFDSMKNLGPLYSPEHALTNLRSFYGFNFFFKDHHFITLTYWLENLALSGNYISRVRTSLMHALSGRRPLYKKFIDNIIETNGYTYLSQDGRYDEYNLLMNYDEFIIHPVFEHYLNRLIQLAVDQELELIIDWVPTNINSFKKLSDHYLEQKDEFFSQLEAHYPNLKIMEQSSYPSSFFLDTDHLAPDGAKRFTEEFRERHFGHLSL